LSTTTTAEVLLRVEQFAREGRARAAIELISEANRVAPDAALEAALVQLRHDAWPEISGQAPLAFPESAPAAGYGPTDTGLPEVRGEDLDAATIGAALHQRGALIVRDLISPEWCTRLRDGIDRSWEAIARFRRTKELDLSWFNPIDTSAYGLTMASRQWVIASGTSYVPDSPRLLFALLEAFDDARVKDVVGDFFGESPALSLIKVAQRRLPPSATGGWHQDAAVYGAVARTLNLWVPVSRCGDVAPGLDLWPRRLDRIVKTAGTEGVAEFTADADAVAALMRETPPVRPVFDEGDAVIFDQWLLHRTASSSQYTEPRFGFECWLFAPSTYPDPNRFIPLVY
jgi:Phytanoyl-CoA dioxygenase (PhyH)